MDVIDFLSKKESGLMKALLILILLLSSVFLDAQVTGKVTYVTDGDTFYLLSSDHVKYTVRVAEIDCPEKTQAYGLEAKSFTMKEILGKLVVIEGVEKDRYGRQIARVKYEGKDLSEELLKAGYAWHYKAYSKSDVLAAMELLAKQKRFGLWVDQEPVAPWEYRKRKN